VSCDFCWAVQRVQASAYERSDLWLLRSATSCAAHVSQAASLSTLLDEVCSSDSGRADDPQTGLLADR